MKELISFEQARAIVLDQSRLMDAETVPISEAAGRTLAQGVNADVDIPPFDNSAMDGFALRVEDLHNMPVRLSIVGEVRAGEAPSTKVTEGKCVGITTGAPIPEGADTVVPVEWTTPIDGKTVQVDRLPKRGRHVRRAGEDVTHGQEVLRAGTRISPVGVGMLATIGCVEVPVRRRPSVAIVTTGDELIDIDRRPVGGQVRNSNLYSLASQAKHAGATVARRDTVADDRGEMERSIVEAIEGNDIVILSGGASVGERDFVRDALKAVGAELLFWRVRQRPGKPMVFATRDGAVVFGLPGNPVSSSVCFEQYVRPAIHRMLGHEHVIPKLHKAVLSQDMVKVKGLYYFARGVVTPDTYGRLHVRDTGPQGSNIYSSMTNANAFIHLPEELLDPPAGTEVLVQRLPWG